MQSSGSDIVAVLHDRPGNPWSLGDLAKVVGPSRSMLAERFHHYVGVPRRRPSRSRVLGSEEDVHVSGLDASCQPPAGRVLGLIWLYGPPYMEFAYGVCDPDRHSRHADIRRVPASLDALVSAWGTLA